MIARLDRYFLVKVAVATLGIATLVLLVVVGLDVVMRLKILLAGDLPPEHSRTAVIVLYYLYQLPALLGPILPLATIVGAIVATAPSLKRGEFTAMGAAGISLRRSCRMLLAFALSVGLLDVALGDQVAPRIEGRRAALEDALTGTSRSARQWTIEETGTWWVARKVVLVPGEAPVLEEVAAAPAGGGMLRADALVADPGGGWLLEGRVIQVIRLPDGRLEKLLLDELACTGDLAIPYRPARLARILMSHTAMTSAELLHRARTAGDGRVYLAACLNRWLRGLLPLMSLLLVLPVFVRFDNKDALILASIRAMVAGLVPLGIAAVGGNEAYSSPWGPVAVIGMTVALAAAPGIVSVARWRM